MSAELLSGPSQLQGKAKRGSACGSGFSGSIELIKEWEEEEDENIIHARINWDIQER